MHAPKFLKEFEKFAVKGNAVDLAVGVIIGAAFTGITNSLVNDIFNPIIGVFTGKVDFSDKVITLRSATETAGAVTINYGAFINTIFNFLLVALVLFLLVRQMNRLREKLDRETLEDLKADNQVPRDIELLIEIRDEIRKNNI